MGRPTSEIDSEALFDFMESGMNLKDGASTLGVSIPTLRMRIAQLKSKEGLLQDFKTIRALRVTELTALILDSITEEKITEAPLGELVKAYKILREKEPDTDPAEVGKVEGGLLAYLLEVERRERALARGIEPGNPPIDAEDAEFEDVLEDEVV